MNNPHVTVYARMLDDIRNNKMPNPLPDDEVLSHRYGVRKNTARRACVELQRRGVILRMWLSDFSGWASFIVQAGIPPELIPADGRKSAAIATDLIRRLPEWVRTQDGRVERSRLPGLRALRTRYSTRQPIIEEAVNILISRGFLERIHSSEWDRTSSICIPTKRAVEHVLVRQESPARTPRKPTP